MELEIPFRGKKSPLPWTCMRSQTNQKSQMLSISLPNDLDLLTQTLGCQTKFSDKFSKYVVDVDKRLKWTVKKSNC